MQFDAKLFVKLMKQNRVAGFVGIPLMFQKLMKDKHFDGEHLSRVCLMFCGGDDISDGFIDEFNSYFEKWGAVGRLRQGYGLTETNSVCTTNSNDDFRRGKPSCHKQFGETMALLAGDALLTEAFSAASRTMGIPAERIVEAMTVLASNAGINGMIGGQVIDLINTDEITADDTVAMYKLKTGALINSAAVCGAILAGADEEMKKAAAVYAEKLGLAFQIIDDILDAEGDEATLGKPVGSDSKNDKKTLVARFGVEKCREFADALTKEALETLDAFSGDKTNLIAITEFLLLRKY